MELSRLIAYAEEFERSPATPFVIVVSFVIGGLVVAPVTVLVTATVLAFGPLHGFVYSFIGMTLSALVTFGLGRLMGRQLIERWSARLYRLSRNLAAKGVLAIVAVRVIPIAPFTVVNMIAGATHIRTRDFLLGNCPRRIARSVSHRRFCGPSDDRTARSESWKLSRSGWVGHRDGDRCVGIAGVGFHDARTSRTIKHEAVWALHRLVSITIQEPFSGVVLRSVILQTGSFSGRDQVGERDESSRFKHLIGNEIRPTQRREIPFGFIAVRE